MIKMFIGQYTNSIDSKGRIIMPAKYRNKVSNELVIARGLDGCLALYPIEKWQEIAAKLTSLPTTKKKARDYARALLSSAADIQLDSKGRINIPDNLLKLANLDKNCLIIGMGDYIELWDADRWSDYNIELDESFEEIAEELVDFEI